MYKILPKYLAVVVLCASLAIFWHGMMMNSMMLDDDAMSASCLSTCVTGGDMGVTHDGNVLTAFTPIVLIMFFLAIFADHIFGEKFTGISFFHKDRHRYLMKTMIMLR